MTITFGSVCSGIEAASVAWHPLGWQTAWLAEIERAPAAVLAHHYPSVWNLGDMTAIAPLMRTGLLVAPDVLVGGTPCQAFSVAGLRNSLDDARGQLSLSYVDLANAIDEQRDTPAVIVWENVPGVLSTKDNAFGCFLGALAGEDKELIAPGGKWPNAGCVYGPQRTVAWRVLDAQYFGVAQRRRRVFVIASARDDFDPATVLFESESVRRDSAPSREARKEIAGTLTSSFGRRGGVPAGGEAPGYLQCFGGGNLSGPIDPAACLTAKGQRIDFEVETLCVTAPVTHTLTAEGHDASEDGTGRGQPIVAFHSNAQPDQMRFDPAVSASLTCSQNAAAMVGPSVRRLTPTECERLQGFPDGYTSVPSRVKRDRPKGSGPCAKQVVTATVVDTSGAHHVSTNYCAAPQPSCARVGMPTGQGYELCKSICSQPAHAEINALQLAGSKASGGVLYVEGHSYVCEGCTMAAASAGVSQMVLGKPPGNMADGPRYKMLGNSMAVPCMAWLGQRIDAALRRAHNAPK